ncbi:MAG: hypothetical protein IRZ05_12230 [Micromonosporaceae bacterium]|nr:hypothetical protein [Micromonosporaceae bacterium]
MKFMIMLFERPTDWTAAPSEVREDALAEHAAFTRYLRDAGIPYSGEAVAPASQARSLRRTEDGLVLQEGPFAAAEHNLGGFYVIDVKDMDQAVEVARRCPTGVGTEIRPIWASAD